MAQKVLTIFEKPIYLSYEPVDPHLFATALGVADTPVEIHVLLREGAVTYAVTGQQLTEARVMGQEVMVHDTSPAQVMEFMLAHGARIYVIEEDLAERGVSVEDLVRGVTPIPRREAARLVQEHDAVMVW